MVASSRSRRALRQWPRVCLALLGSLSLLAPSVLRAQQPRAGAKSPSGLWQEADDKPLLAARGNLSAATARRGVVPAEYRTLRLDQTQLAARLAAAPPESAAVAANVARRRYAGVAASTADAAGAADNVAVAPAEIELPLPHSDRFARFAVVDSPIMEDGLAARYPQFRTYAAQGIDNPALSARLDVTPQGFHAIIFSPGGQIYVDPYFADGSDPATVIAYYKRDYAAAKSFQCLVPSPAAGDAAALRAALDAAAAPDASPYPTGASLRIYRLAVATTGEYAAAVGGGTVIGALGSVITSVNRVTALYERDFAIRLKLIDNEDKIIYTNAGTDPYTNANPNSLLTQNQSTLDSVIGTANYDIGHVFSTAGGGLAGLGVVCTAGRKAQGETGVTNPTGDPYDIDYVAHEMGHQFGANHTFNSTTGSCSGNRNAGTAYEPGSGVTIMAYAGICSSGSNVQDLAPHSDDYFHTVSYDEINNYTTTGNGKNASATIATGNTPPVVTVPSTYTIPIGTPFALTASATDPNVDHFTYCWEEYDLGAAVNATSLNGLDNGASPLFRSYAPTTNPTRTFPSLTYILNNANVPPLTGADGYLVGEALPSQARGAFQFRCTVRDNLLGGGGTNWGLTTLVVSSAAGPFAITAPNAAATLAGGSLQTIAWNVANTSAAPVSCANVKISLSTDGGLTFPIVLADSVPNTGSAVVTLPNTGNVATTQGRIKVEAVGNVFFDINDANLTITSTNAPPSIAAGGGGVTVQRGTPSAVTATVATATPGSNALTGVTVSNVPDGATVTGALTGGGRVVQLTAQAACRLTTTLSTRVYPINVTVTDAAGATASTSVNLNVQPNPAPTLGAYADASVGQGGGVTVNPSAGPADANFNLAASPFAVLPTTLPGGGTLSVDQTTGAVTAATTSATTQGATTVRVTLQDACGAAVAKTFTLTVTAPVNAAPTLTGGAPPSAATVGAAYSYAFTAGGTPTPTFSLSAGALPPGLSLAANGLLSGTPTTPGVYAGLQVTASNGVNPSAGSAVFSISVGNTLANYAASYGLSGAGAAASADPDGDGIVNLLEYALNLNPAAPNGAAAVFNDSQVRDYGGVKYLSIRFVRVPLATDLTYTVEASGDLTNWSAVATSVRGAAFTGAGLVTDDASNAGAHVVEVRDTVAQDAGAGAQKRFLRLRVTQ